MSNIQFPKVNKLQEMHSILAETVEEWFAEATQKGLEQGLQLGEAEIWRIMMMHLLPMCLALMHKPYCCVENTC